MSQIIATLMIKVSLNLNKIPFVHLLGQKTIKFTKI